MRHKVCRTESLRSLGSYETTQFLPQREKITDPVGDCIDFAPVSLLGRYFYSGIGLLRQHIPQINDALGVEVSPMLLLHLAKFKPTVGRIAYTADTLSS